jgi:trimethylamine--corrinoid protein Co-methyltransferase
MHERAVELVEQVGLIVSHEGTKRRLSEYAGVIIADDRVCFKAPLVEQALARRQLPHTDEEPFVMVSGAYASHVLDMGTGKVRPSTLQDLVELTQLADSFGMVGSAPVYPLDLPCTELQEIAMYKVSWENSPIRASGIHEMQPKSTPLVADYVYKMSQIAERFFSVGLWIISPFSTRADGLEVIGHFSDRHVPMWVAAMPIAGTTAPIFLPGAYLQCMAELLAGLTLIHLINPDGSIYFYPKDAMRVYTFDMRDSSFVFGSPEDILSGLFQMAVNEFYGQPTVAKSFLTHAEEPDAQAAAEKAAHTMIAASAGARILSGFGLLSVDEYYSGEQVVIDYEISQYVQRFCRGSESISEKTLALETIKEVAAGGNFLEHESTLKHFREAVWYPSLFTHQMYSTWQADGAPSIRIRAREMARQRIADHRYQLPPKVQRELDRIYAHAEQRLVG